jgi:hypothetical protein
MLKILVLFLTFLHNLKSGKSAQGDQIRSLNDFRPEASAFRSGTFDLAPLIDEQPIGHTRAQNPFWRIWLPTGASRSRTYFKFGPRKG